MSIAVFIEIVLAALVGSLLTMAAFYGLWRLVEWYVLDIRYPRKFGRKMSGR